MLMFHYTSNLYDTNTGLSVIVISKISGLRATSDESLIGLSLVPADATKWTSPFAAWSGPDGTRVDHSEPRLDNSDNRDNSEPK